MSSESESARVAARLCAALRRNGLRIGIDRMQAFVQGATFSGDLYWAGRLTLLSRAEEIPVYDRVFHGLLSEPPQELSGEDLGEGDRGNRAARAPAICTPPTSRPAGRRYCATHDSNTSRTPSCASLHG